MTELANQPKVPAEPERVYLVSAAKVREFWDLLDRARDTGLTDRYAVLALQQATQQIEQVLLHAPIVRYRVR